MFLIDTRKSDVILMKTLSIQLKSTQDTNESVFVTTSWTFW